MINPELDDWWSHKRITNLRYRDNSFSGAGVSMQVLAKAFNENEFTWFSNVYGEFNDNLILVAMDNQAANKFSKTRYEGQETKRAFFGPPLKNEFKITDEVAVELGFSASDNGFEISNSQKTLFYTYSHDNCFFSIEPVTADLLKRVIQAILQQHSFYLGKEIQWQEVESQLIDMIKNNNEIDIQSDAKKHCAWIPQIEQKKGWFWKRFRPGTIIVDGAIARFRD